jgi:hypothetical protein
LGGADLSRFVSGLSGTVPLALTSIASSFGVGWLSALAARATRPDRFTIATEFATRNVAVASTVAVTLLDQPAFAFFGAAYFLTEIPIMLLAVALYRRVPASIDLPEIDREAEASCGSSAEP